MSPGQPVKLCVALSLLLILAGCGSPPERQQGESVDMSTEVDDITVTKVKRADGREMECVVYRPYNGGGISCDWGAR